MTELERSWRTASSVLRGKSVVVDLTDVTSIDEAGEQLLVRMQKEGAHLIPEPQVGEPILTGVSGRRAAAQGGRAPRRCLLERLRGRDFTSLRGPFHVPVTFAPLRANVIGDPAAKSGVFSPLPATCAPLLTAQCSPGRLAFWTDAYGEVVRLPKESSRSSRSVFGGVAGPRREPQARLIDVVRKKRCVRRPSGLDRFSFEPLLRQESAPPGFARRSGR